MPALNKKIPDWWYIFITEYLKNGNNGTQAFLKAKPNCEFTTARTNSSQLLAKTNFLKVLNEEREKLEQKNGISREKCIKILADMAQCDLADFVTTDESTGEVKLKSNWSEKGKSHVLDSIEQVNTTLESGQVVTRTKLRRESKVKAMELLMKALGYLEEKVNINHTFSPSQVISTVSQLRKEHGLLGNGNNEGSVDRFKELGEDVDVEFEVVK